ncbi:ABC transporter ATP-binding protein [Halopelagius longus]|uniref:ABC transporter ATP-binding protein n=1 Tax=Halopelagius longus TaxID=1236180 RepID=A0A1H0YY34_9EURY|nr:ABC transporter ATP-binding protein [Halopelagius longus]RDI73146.1 ABC transporter ATP-binding protein [Halopelagius longus]SDQ20109.1 fluoroquinolone transport system ATP-binding protein [Halopelagius longus]
MNERQAAGSEADADDPRAAERGEGSPVVRVEDLRFTYPGAEAETLRGLDFEIRPAEVFGFLGPSGAGKSTTQKVLVGLLDDYEGTVSVFGRDVRSWGGAYYERVGVSSEAPNTYLKLTGRENLALFASLYEGETRDPEELLELVGLTDAADRRVSGYSKGMKMRLNFARSLLHDPDLLFLDEPTTGLDPSNARRIKDIVSDLQAGGTTVFVTTHDMAVADELCDRVAFIVDGDIAVIAPPEDLKRRYGSKRVRAEYVAEDGTTRTTEFDPENPADGDALADLIRSGRYESLHTEEATLEDVFIEVTGRGLR